MPAERIAENLAFINWTVLTGLAFGSFAAVVLARLRTDATRGFVSFTAACAVAIGILAFLSDQALPTAVAGQPIRIDPVFDLPRRLALGLFCLLAALYVVALIQRRRAPLLAGAAMAAAGASLVFGALGWSSSVLLAIPLLLQFVVLTMATGGVFAAMILGHWYLVTPKLPEAPLILISRILLAVVGLQVVLFAVWVTTGAGPGGGGPFAVLVGPWAMFVWLRLIVGLIFPLIVSWAAVQTARSRSMESATGLLYINVGTIAAGTILAAGLYFGAGLLV
ncbi:MAG TPA: hypothetical protein VHM48_05120 [Candidatus Limnocylindrales bacterium]|nr:hypothetical protein [Candidatus Limnocylindrales bacterium]